MVCIFCGTTILFVMRVCAHIPYLPPHKAEGVSIPIIWVMGNHGGAEGNIHLPRKHHHFISALQSHLFRRSIPKPVSRSFGSFLLVDNIRSNLIIAETNKSQMKTLNHSVLPNNTLHEFPTSIHQWQWLGERDDTRQI